MNFCQEAEEKNDKKARRYCWLVGRGMINSQIGGKPRYSLTRIHETTHGLINLCRIDKTTFGMWMSRHNDEEHNNFYTISHVGRVNTGWK